MGRQSSSCLKSLPKEILTCLHNSPLKLYVSPGLAVHKSVLLV